MLCIRVAFLLPLLLLKELSSTISPLILEQARPPDTGAKLFEKVTFRTVMLLLSRDKGACRSVRYRSMNDEFSMATLA